MKYIKFAEGIDLTIDGETEFFPDMLALDKANIPQDCRTEIIRALMAMHFLDLSEAYDGHTVTMRLVPVND